MNFTIMMVCQDASSFIAVFAVKHVGSVGRCALAVPFDYFPFCMGVLLPGTAGRHFPDFPCAVVPNVRLRLQLGKVIITLCRE